MTSKFKVRFRTRKWSSKTVNNKLYATTFKNSLMKFRNQILLGFAMCNLDMQGTVLRIVSLITDETLLLWYLSLPASVVGEVRQA